MELGLSQVGASVKDFFGELVNTKARETKFVQRLSPLNGLAFLQTMVFGFIENPDASLDSLTDVCLDLTQQLERFSGRVVRNAISPPAFWLQREAQERT